MSYLLSPAKSYPSFLLTDTAHVWDDLECLNRFPFVWMPLYHNYIRYQMSMTKPPWPHITYRISKSLSRYLGFFCIKLPSLCSIGAHLRGLWCVRPNVKSKPYADHRQDPRILIHWRFLLRVKCHALPCPALPCLFVSYDRHQRQLDLAGYDTPPLGIVFQYCMHITHQLQPSFVSLVERIRLTHGGSQLGPTALATFGMWRCTDTIGET